MTDTASKQRELDLARRELVLEVLKIAATGELPDGDAVDTPTLLWAEAWARKIEESKR